jgi:hypothetical protein
MHVVLVLRGREQAGLDIRSNQIIFSMLCNVEIEELHSSRISVGNTTNKAIIIQ